MNLIDNLNNWIRLKNSNRILNDVKVVFFNGTAGKYEEKDYQKGTLKLLNELSNSNAKVIIGGGDTVSAVTSLGFENSFEFLSSGGGATLEYVAYGNLKALDWVDKNNVDN